MQADLGLHLDHLRSDLDEAQSQRVELGDGKAGSFRHRSAQAPHQPIGARMQEKPELVGRRSGAGCAVSGKMRLPGLDVVLGCAALAVDILVERLGLPTGKIGDDEAGVSPLSSDLDAGDDTLDAAPAAGAVDKLLEAADLGCFADASKRASVVASKCATCLCRVVVGAKPRMKSTPLARHQPMTSGLQ